MLFIEEEEEEEGEVEDENSNTAAESDHGSSGNLNMKQSCRSWSRCSRE